MPVEIDPLTRDRADPVNDLLPVFYPCPTFADLGDALTRICGCEGRPGDVDGTDPA